VNARVGAGRADAASAGAMEPIGKSRILRAIFRWSDELYEMLASVVLFILSVIGLILGVVKPFARRWLRASRACRNAFGRLT